MGGDVTNKPKPSKRKERPPKSSQLAEEFEEATLRTFLPLDPAQQKNLKNLSPKASHPFFSHLLLGDCDSHKFIIDTQACFFYIFFKPIRNEGDA